MSHESVSGTCHVLTGMKLIQTLRVRGFPALLITVGLSGAVPAFSQLSQPNQPSQGAPAREWLQPPPGSAQLGAALYQQHCTACHTIDSSKIGPAHRGVMGRRVGSLPGYKYSAELAASRLRWTPQTLNTWLADPEDLVSGQRMGFQIDSMQERADLIAYLATLK